MKYVPVVRAAISKAISSNRMNGVRLGFSSGFGGSTFSGSNGGGVSGSTGGSGRGGGVCAGSWSGGGVCTGSSSGGMFTGS